jgi:phosphoglycerate dehydrogenase-like enzyme
VNAWIPDAPGHEAVGDPPDGVELRLIPRSGELPAELLDAEFLVPPVRDRRVVDLLARMTRLQVVQTLSAGVDRLVDRIPAGVTLCDAHGSRDVPVAEWTMAAILACKRGFPELRDRQREHEWAPGQAHELAGSTVTILGYGAIGAALEARLEPFEVELIRVARDARPGVHPVSELPQLLPRTNVLVVLLPLTPATRGLVDGHVLSLLPTGALLVNAGRGAVVDTEALLERLSSGELTAALDVTDPEPLPPDHPLWRAPGTLITPHVAGATQRAEVRAFTLVGEQIGRWARGEPLSYVVDRDR